MLPLSDTTMRAVEHALDGLKARFDVHAANITNANTPGYRAARVDFETSLRDALATGDVDRAAAPAVLPGSGLPDPQGNTVNLEDELAQMMKDSLLQEAMVNAYNFKVGVLRTAIQGR